MRGGFEMKNLVTAQLEKNNEKMKKNLRRMYMIQKTFLGHRMGRAILYSSLAFVGSLMCWVIHPEINLLLWLCGSFTVGGILEAFFGFDQAELHVKRRNDREKLEDYIKYEIENEQLYHRNLAMKQALSINNQNQSLKDVLVVEPIDQEQSLQQEKEALEDLYKEALNHLDNLSAKAILKKHTPKKLANLKAALISFIWISMVTHIMMYVAVPTIPLAVVSGIFGVLTIGYFTKKSIDEHQAHKNLTQAFLGKTPKEESQDTSEAMEETIDRISVIRLYLEENKKKFRNLALLKRREEAKEKVRAQYAQFMPAPEEIPTYEESELRAQILELQNNQTHI